MIVLTGAGERLTPGDAIARGGEASIHLLPGRPGQVAKLYLRPREGALDKLRHMLASPPADPTRGLGHASIAWPRELLLDAGGRLVGFTMPQITQAVSLLTVFNPRRRAQVLPGFDRRYLHRSARNLASALDALHSSGYVVGDLNEGNVLVTPRTLVTLIDCDSFQVEERRGGKIVIHPCPVGRAEYTAPELQGQSFIGTYRRPEHDAFGLAVLIFQLLVSGSHPFRGQWLAAGEPPPLEEKIARGLFPWAGLPQVGPPAGAGPAAWEGLHPALADAFLRCFVDGQAQPALRPGAAAWAEILALAEADLQACPAGHWFGAHLRRCPECGLKAKGAGFFARPQGRGGPAAAAAGGRAGTGGRAAAGLGGMAGAGAGGGVAGSRAPGLASSLARGLAGLVGLPGRLLGAGLASLAGAFGLAASAPASWLRSLRWTAGLALLALLASFGLSTLMAALHRALLGLLDPAGSAGAGGPAALWALSAGALGAGLGAGLRQLARRPGEALGAAELQAFLAGAAPALGGWLGGWLGAALVWRLTRGADWPSSLLGAAAATGSAASPAWILAWTLYGGAIAALGPGWDAAQPPRAPLGWAAVAGVFAALGWAAARLGGAW